MANSFPYAGPRRGPYQRRSNNDPFASIRRNQRIRAAQARVISPEGKQLGIMPTEKALQLAIQVGLDLVEIAPNAQPPVCRIMDFGKYVYEEQKKSSHAKATAGKVKEVEFTARIADNDFMTKLRRTEQFLNMGSKVKLRLKFRGRELAHPEIGFGVINKALAELTEMGHPDSPPKLLGKHINVMLTPLPANKRKPKFLRPDDEGEDDIPDDSASDADNPGDGEGDK
ncbi:translation initiation factor IF-3 [Ereboglobus sp. PH5-5]|uniref:translation initiation factor IF-3 n=1 Tax=unclassified Ereboglobus TaxID=2626932 RepID=UPI0024070DCB|nr:MULTISPECIES: translation initiation factor IF-3 [unclassified Ereboglobus]MDF9827798.1 translation initiation factor IF-3 [Ereboglobus sp. PH5-10]MDF9833587.1 translation initiation factor IF-3 [Ereboglobus sp. PH5-5]